MFTLALFLAAFCSNDEGNGGFAPDAPLFSEYVADPRRPTFALTSINAYDSTLGGAGNSRNGIRMGARFGIYRFGVPWLEGPLQVDANVGFLGEFDRDNSTDNLGWDGLFGLDLTWRANERMAFQFGFSHDSSHLGDEYIESTGRMRIDYTREELNLGMRYAVTPELATYVEYGNGHTLRNSRLMERGRAQAGFEFELDPMWFGDRVAPFAAVDVGSYQEDDWSANLNVQVGIVRRMPSGSVWRFGFEYYDGRSPIGELFMTEETHFAIGLWVDP